MSLVHIDNYMYELKTQICVPRHVHELASEFKQGFTLVSLEL